MKYQVILAIFVFVSIAAGSRSAQVYPDTAWENGFTEPWHFYSDHYPKEAATVFKTRWSLMEHEAKETHLDEWSGLYTLGIFDLRGYAFRWSPDSGYVYASVDACRANVDGVNYGKVRLSGNLIEMTP